MNKVPIPTYDPVDIVARLYDGKPWQGSTDKHSGAVRKFWDGCWEFCSPRGDQSDLPREQNWDGSMYHYYHREIDELVSALTQDEAWAVLTVIKSEVNRPLCLHIMVYAIKMGWTPACGRDS